MCEKCANLEVKGLAVHCNSEGGLQPCPNRGPGEIGSKGQAVQFRNDVFLQGLAEGRGVILSGPLSGLVGAATTCL